MRLLWWTSTYAQTIGGGPLLAPLLVEALVERGHDITVITNRRPPGLPEEERREGARILRFPFRTALSGDTALVRQVKDSIIRVKRSFRPDISYIFSSGGGELFHHVTARFEPTPLALTLHDRFPEAYYRPEALVGRNLRAADWVTACSASVLATARQHVPEIADRSSVIWNSVPEPSCAPSPPAPDPRRILYAGRLVRKKGVDVLLCAFATLKDRHPSLRLEIAGDGAERRPLEAEAAGLGVADSVVFHGAVAREAVAALMGEVGLVVVPSRVEPFGLVALEAAQMACPVVASDVDGLPEVVVQGETGLIVPPDDASALAAAIASLLNRPDRASAMGMAAQKRAFERFPWDGFVSAYDELFRKLVGRP